MYDEDTDLIGQVGDDAAASRLDQRVDGSGRSRQVEAVGSSLRAAEGDKGAVFDQPDVRVGSAGQLRAGGRWPLRWCRPVLRGPGSPSPVRA